VGEGESEVLCKGGSGKRGDQVGFLWRENVVTTPRKEVRKAREGPGHQDEQQTVVHTGEKNPAKIYK